VAGVVVDGEDVEAAGAVGDVAFGEKTLRGAGDDVLLIGGDAGFGEYGEIAADAGAACGAFALVLGVVVIVVQAFAGGPMDQLEDGAGEEGHSW
jgi:hypothetical protein